MSPTRRFQLLLLVAAAICTSARGDADLILHHGKVLVPVPSHEAGRAPAFQQAIAIRGSEIAATGTDAEMLALRGPQTVVVDLGGRLVIPGLIDSHTHPADACLTEFDHEL